MALDPLLQKILVCPQCKGGLELVDQGLGLSCSRCKIKFPIRDGIPIMLIEEAVDLRSGIKVSNAPSVKLPRVTFRVTKGPDQGMTFQLEQGTCRAIGRASFDPNKTSVFNFDIALQLDESTKSLILKYVSKQFRKSQANAPESGEKLGQFRRTSDVVLTDTTLSKLHAMIFSDETDVGVLDLVSKNGTYVNGEEVESRVLKRSDVVELGETDITFEG